MKTEPMLHLCTSDISGKLRGKAVPARVADAGRPARVGWTPTNVQITCFDDIADSPYGALGDLLLCGDMGTRARIDFGDGGPVEDFALGDVVHLDGRPWECCTRAILRAALERLRAASGLTLDGRLRARVPPARARRAARRGLRALGLPQRAGALRGDRRGAGAGRDRGRDHGARVRAGPVRGDAEPVAGLAIADQAAVLRETVRATGERLGRRVSFAPLIEAGGIGNGVHVHLSFRDAAGAPATYDPAGPQGMSAATDGFVAGVLAHLPAILAFLAPSVISYGRLVPHRWSAAFDNLGVQDREAAVRICPVRRLGGGDVAAQFHFEVRACDAAASPHLALAALVHAGAAGIEAGLAAPEATAEDLSLLPAEALRARGHRRLPGVARRGARRARGVGGGARVVSRRLRGDLPRPQAPGDGEPRGARRGGGGPRLSIGLLTRFQS